MLQYWFKHFHIVFPISIYLIYGSVSCIHYTAFIISNFVKLASKSYLVLFSQSQKNLNYWKQKWMILNNCCSKIYSCYYRPSTWRSFMILLYIIIENDSSSRYIKSVTESRKLMIAEEICYIIHAKVFISHKMCDILLKCLFPTVHWIAHKNWKQNAVEQIFGHRFFV